jgi:CheY-specific phosphatase CheX
MQLPTSFPDIVVTSVINRTRDYLMHEVGIEVKKVTNNSADLDRVKLREFTAIIGVGGRIGLLVAFSFPRKLVDVLYSRLTAGFTVPPGEEADFRRSTVTEVANIIIGHCTADFSSFGERICISPPILLEETKHIHRMKDAMFNCISFVTTHGAFEINLVGPREMFDARLDYVSEGQTWKS